MSNLALDLFVSEAGQGATVSGLSLPEPIFKATVYGHPEPGGSKKGVTWHAKDGRSGTNVIDANPKAGKWRDHVAEVTGKLWEGHRLIDDPIWVQFVFYVARPKGHYGAKGNLLPSAPKWPAVRPDALKLARVAEDGMTGQVYRDDALIVDEVLRKRFGTPERVEISVWLAR